ncbi:NAD(P)-binding protein [Hypoxylon sp. FL1150]|nr:NAD(P)-binding protein [Hypoxylon sp. FL1150]
MAQAPLFDITPEKEASKLQFLRRQFSAPSPAVSRRDADLSGKTAIVTGANGGIGLECSRQLLDLGLSKLILAVRDEAKGEAARKTLTATKALEASQSIEVWKLDHASYESVVSFAERVEHFNPRLDFAILNAGVNRGWFATNPITGHEENLQINYLSTVLLLLLLLRTSKEAGPTANIPESSPGRIVVVSSDTAAWAKWEVKHESSLLKAFDNEAKWDAFDSYATTKLLGQLFVTELAKHVPSSLAVVNCANPGLCYGSGLAHDLGWTAAIFVRAFGRSSAMGARTLVHAATTQGEKSHGQYVEDGKLRSRLPALIPRRIAMQVIKQLWAETMDELSSPAIKGIIKGFTK